MPADARSGGARVAKKTAARRTVARKSPTKAKRAPPAAKSVSASRGAKKPGWTGTAKAYASLGLAKGLRVAASTIGLVRGGKKKR